MRTIALLVVLGAGCATKAAPPMKQAPPPDDKKEAKKADPTPVDASAPDTGDAGDADDPEPEPNKPADALADSTSRGGMRDRKSAVPARVGQPISQGNLDKVIIRRYIKRVINKISECYEKELTTQPALEGKVTIQFEIAPDGKVSKSTGSGMPKVDACVAAVVQAIEFPKPQGGGSVAVTYPFVFRPPGG